MPEQQGDKELASFIRRKQDELMGLILKGGLSPTDEKLIYKDLDKLASNALTVAGRSGYSEGGTISKIPSSIKDKFAALKAKIKAKIKAKGSKTVKAAKGTLVAKNYMNPVKVVNNLKGKR